MTKMLVQASMSQWTAGVGIAVAAVGEEAVAGGTATAVEWADATAEAGVMCSTVLVVVVVPTQNLVEEEEDLDLVVEVAAAVGMVEGKSQEPRSLG